jgi:hypothetical protein
MANQHTPWVNVNPGPNEICGYGGAHTSTDASLTLSFAFYRGDCTRDDSTGESKKEVGNEREKVREVEDEEEEVEEETLRSSKPRLWPCSTLSTQAHFLTVRTCQT